MRRQNSLPLIYGVVVMTAVMGCAARSQQAAPEVPEAPMAPAQPSLTSAPAREAGEDVEALEEALAREENNLRSLVQSFGETPAPESPAGPTRGQTPKAQPSPPKATGATKADCLEPEASSSPCDRACRALESMRRSAEGICRLSGDNTDRCERAHSRVDAAEELVRGAGCSC